MAELTHISWADSTINFWIGCTKVSPACDHCYAEVYGNRFGVPWGSGMQRRKTINPRAGARTLQRKAAAQGFPLYCFSNSLSDIFDNETPIEWLIEAFDIIRETPDVIYLLLTKRIGIAAQRCADAGGLPSNARLGATFCNQSEWDRDWGKLRDAQISTRSRWVFGSFEPLLGPINFDLKWMPAWVIVGGESGKHARPPQYAWIQDMHYACDLTGATFHFKQWGNVSREMKALGHAGNLLDGKVYDARPPG